MIGVNWQELKLLIDSNTVDFRHIETSVKYIILAWDGDFKVECVIYKNSDESVEYEGSYKTLGETQVSVKDSDGAAIINPKLATESRSYQSMFASSTIGKFEGVVCKDVNNQNKTVFSQKIYDDQGSEITDPANEGSSVLTTIEWSPTISYDVQGFCLYQKTQPTSDIFLNAIAAHKVPAQYGGSKPSIEGYNLRLGPYGNREVDWVGDSTTAVTFDPINYSHEHLLKIYHPTGTAHDILIEVIWYV